MRKLFTSSLYRLRMCCGAAVIRLFPRQGILGISPQAWQLLSIIADSRSTGFVLFYDPDIKKDHHAICLLPSTREITHEDEWLLRDDLAHLEELGLIRFRDNWEQDKVYAITRKGARYARYLPTVQTQSPNPEEPAPSDDSSELPHFPALPLGDHFDRKRDHNPGCSLDSFSREELEAVRIDSIEIETR